MFVEQAKVGVHRTANMLAHIRLLLLPDAQKWFIRIRSEPEVAVWPTTQTCCGCCNKSSAKTWKSRPQVVRCTFSRVQGIIPGSQSSVPARPHVWQQLLSPHRRPYQLAWGSDNRPRHVDTFDRACWRSPPGHPMRRSLNSKVATNMHLPVPHITRHSCSLFPVTELMETTPSMRPAERSTTCCLPRSWSASSRQRHRDPLLGWQTRSQAGRGVT